MPRTTVSDDYQVAIPEKIRQEVPFTPGEAVRIVIGDGFITLIPDRAQAEEWYPHPEPARESPTFAELVAAQGVKPVESPDKMYGGWPEDELDDGFENAVRQWRDDELRHQDD